MNVAEKRLLRWMRGRVLKDRMNLMISNERICRPKEHGLRQLKKVYHHSC